MEKKLAEQREKLEELQFTIGGLEKERDYYFKGLREVEILCTTLQAQMDPELTTDKLVADVLQILYTEDPEELGEAEATADDGVAAEQAQRAVGECF